MSESSNKVVFGKFGRPNGVRGELRLWLFNPDTELLDLGMELQFKVDNVWQTRVIDYARFPDPKYAVIGLEGVTDRDAAAALTNIEVYIDRAEFGELEDGEFYQGDLIGVQVFVKDGDTETPIGKVKGFLDPVSDTDIMAVTGPRIQGRLLVLMTQEIMLKMDLESVVLAPLNEWAPADFELKPEP